MTASPDKLLECALSAARAAAGYAMDHYSLRHEIMEISDHDIKLKLDLKCQEKAIEAVKSRFPGSGIIAEERMPDSRNQPESSQENRLEWIIDPIDGTVNFFHGLPFWCSSVAACQDDVVLAGAVFAPVLDLCYAAAKDSPPSCNNAVIRVSDTKRLSDALVLTGADRDISDNVPDFGILASLAREARRVRLLGSAALDICQVAHGRADGYFESGIYIWDVAAAGLIVRQAGGRTDFTGRLSNNRLQFLATNGLIHQSMKDAIARAGWKTEGRGQKTEDGREKEEARRRKTHDTGNIRV